MPPKKQKPMKIKTGPVRDELMVKLITGSTKAAVHKDQKKEASRKVARKKVESDEN